MEPPNREAFLFMFVSYYSHMKQFIFIYFLFQLSVFAQDDKNISVVSLEKANVVYRGIMNPIKIAVPGAKSYKVEAPGELTKIDSLGNYYWNITAVSGLKASIKIDIIMPDDSSRHEEKEFKINPISRRSGYIASDFEYHTYEMTHEQIRKLNLKTIVENFNYSVDTTYFRVEHFTIEIQGQETIWIKGNKMNNKVFNFLKDLPIGTELFIGDIHPYNPHQYDLTRIETVKVRIVDSIDSKTLKPIILSNNLNYKNIIYRGIDNSLKIEVPGAKSFTMNASGLSEMTQDSTYTINVNNIKEDKIHLDFKILTQHDSVLNIKELFYIKNITPNKITINDKSCKNCVLKLTPSELKNAILEIKVDDAEESWSNIRVWDFTIKMPNGNVLEMAGDKITDELLNKLLKLSKNSILEITIPYYGSIGVIQDPPPQKIMILK